MRTKQEESEAVEVEERGGRRKLLVMIALTLLAAGVATWWFMLRPAGAQEAPTPGEVIQLESIQVNLAGGHYLKVGLALQAVEGAHEIEGSKALDAAIELFSGRGMAELADSEQRDELKGALLAELDHRYHGDVMEVYFTDFVTQ